MSEIKITAECVADIPYALQEREDIDIIFYDIETENGIFRDTDEIDANNIMEYMADGKKRVSTHFPSATEYKNFFKSKLEDYDEVIHICIGSGISDALENAKQGRDKLGLDGKRIHIVDSQHVSSGSGYLAYIAARDRDKGMNSDQIIAHLVQIIPGISTTFIAYNADYLYYNNQVSKLVKNICQLLHLHPVLYVKDGVLTLKKVYWGDYKKSVRKYVASELRKAQEIRKEAVFITYAACNHAMIKEVKQLVRGYAEFDEMWEQEASATVTSNCGPMTCGVIYVREKE